MCGRRALNPSISSAVESSHWSLQPAQLQPLLSHETLKNLESKVSSRVGPKKNRLSQCVSSLGFFPSLAKGHCRWLLLVQQNAMLGGLSKTNAPLHCRAQRETQSIWRRRYLDFVARRTVVVHLTSLFVCLLACSFGIVAIGDGLHQPPPPSEVAIFTGLRCAVCLFVLCFG